MVANVGELIYIQQTCQNYYYLCQIVAGVTLGRAMVEAWDGMGVGVWVSSALEARRGLLFKLTTTSLETTVGMKDRG